MSTPANPSPKTNEPEQWTVMIYFAGDNPLSPTMISQLKAIKEAGFQLNTKVVVHFDPSEPGAPTRVYDVGRERRQEELKKSLPKSDIGDGRNSFVRNLVEDIVDLKGLSGRAARELVTKLKASEGEIAANTSLQLFLNFCKENFKADHYILFLVGHGMVVGNDAFLPDDFPKSGISLRQLREILESFPRLELLGLHSCSMSAVEVAYELKGRADYLMASEGPAFVGSWPYRQLLKKVFNAVETGLVPVETGSETEEAARKKNTIPNLIESLYDLSLYNGTDFISAGYSSDLSLCSLAKAEALKALIQSLVRALRAGLQDTAASDRIEELILLSHLESQSYWQESYTDLYDFCRCLQERCDQKNALQKSIWTAAQGVRDAVEALVVRSEYFGATYQYSHGLSIYFPWSPPLEDAKNPIMANYEQYAFTTELKPDSWFAFLNTYFDKTLRDSREKEEGREADKLKPLFLKAASLVTAATNVPVSGSSVLQGDPTKPDPRVGIECGCGTIKNHPREFSISQAALAAFE
jgi:hypothetical protein